LIFGEQNDIPRVVAEQFCARHNMTQFVDAITDHIVAELAKPAGASPTNSLTFS
jgi:hypothetical protein